MCTCFVVRQLGLTGLQPPSKIFVQLDDVVLGKNNRDIFSHFVRYSAGQHGTNHVPSFDGTQFTSWNFFACTTNTWGNVANRVRLTRYLSAHVHSKAHNTHFVAMTFFWHPGH